MKPLPLPDRKPARFELDGGCILALVLAFIAFLSLLCTISIFGKAMRDDDDAPEEPEPEPPHEIDSQAYYDYQPDYHHPLVPDPFRSDLKPQPLPPHLLEQIQRGLDARESAPARCPY